MDDIDRTKFAVGDLVKPRPAAELKLGRTAGIGTVVASEHIEGWGYGVKVQWPGEEVPSSFQSAHLFDPA